MPGFVRRFFSVEHMLAKEKVQGEIPSSRQTYRDLLSIALPSVLELVLVSLIGSIDTMMVGSIGPEAIAAVGLTGQPRMLFLCVFAALNVGVTAVVARRKGQGRQDLANEALRNALVLLLGISAVLTVLALSFAPQLMRLAGAKDETIGMASEYFFIISTVLPLNAVTLCINAAQRGVGNTRITMYVNIVSNVVNIFLNFVLINGYLGFPRLGTRGAAIATLVGFTVGFLCALFSVVSRASVGRFLHLSRHDDWRLKRDTLKAIGGVGSSAMLEQIALRIGFFTYARLVADLGTMAFAAHQVAMQFTSLSYSVGDGIGIAGTSLVGQMLGRERPDLATIYGKVAQRIAMVTALCLAALLILLRFPLASLFTSDAQVVALVAEVLLIVAAFQPFQTSSVVISGCLRGAGDTRYVAAVMLLCVTVIRPVLTYVGIHVLGFGLLGAWSASLVDMVIRMSCVYHRFHRGRWTSIKV